MGAHENGIWYESFIIPPSYSGIKRMPLSRSSNLIKAWLARGKYYNNIQGMFRRKATEYHEILRGEKGKPNMVRFKSTLADFNVRRSEPELVHPSRPTPNTIKLLSDIDRQLFLQCEVPLIMFYPGVPDMKDKDPAKVIKNALAEALVYYYPMAGRMRIRRNQQLAVDCTTEGVVFGEADAEISLEQLGEQPLLPPYPYLEKILYGEAGFSIGIAAGRPLLTMQVTRLSCGGFILALKFNHAMSDAAGIIQFLTAIIEFARDASTPSILPIWRRHLLNSRDPLHDVTPTNHPLTPPDDLIHRTFTFNASNIATLRSYIPRHLRHSTTSFELISAALWRCRTIALQFEPKEEVHLAFAVNARRMFNPTLPMGYYGNAFTLATVVSTAGKIYDDGALGYTVEKVKEAKVTVMEEYKRSLIAPGILRGVRLPVGTYTITDASRLGFLNLDFGWGNPVYGGPADNTCLPHMVGFITSFRNEKGEEVKVVPVYLPEDAMDRFDKALDSLLKEQWDHAFLD